MWSARRMFRGWWLVIAVMACGPGEPSAGDETSGGSAAGTGTTGEATPTSGEATPTSGEASDESTAGEPACVTQESPWTAQFPPNWQLGCGAPMLCAGDGAVTIEVEGAPEAPSSVVIDQVERVRCMVQALLDRSLGQLDVFLAVDGETRDALSIEIVGEHGVARSAPAGCVLIEPTPCRNRETLRVLRPPAFFAACVGGDARALWACLADAFEPQPACVSAPLECPGG